MYEYGEHFWDSTYPPTEVVACPHATIAMIHLSMSWSFMSFDSYRFIPNFASWYFPFWQSIIHLIATFFLFFFNGWFLCDNQFFLFFLKHWFLCNNALFSLLHQSSWKHLESITSSMNWSFARHIIFWIMLQQ